MSGKAEILLPHHAKRLFIYKGWWQKQNHLPFTFGYDHQHELDIEKAEEYLGNLPDETIIELGRTEGDIFCRKCPRSPLSSERKEKFEMCDPTNDPKSRENRARISLMNHLGYPESSTQITLADLKYKRDSEIPPELEFDTWDFPPIQEDTTV